MLQAGDLIPDFVLPSDTMGDVSASSLRGQRYVLYFYPKDDTSGCTTEACNFRDNLASFGNDSFQMGVIPEAFRIQFVDGFRPRWPGGKPAVLRLDFHTANRLVVSRCFTQFRDNRVTCQCCRQDRRGSQIFETIFFFGGDPLIDSGVSAITKLSNQVTIMLARITPGFRGDFRRKQIQD